MVRKKVRTQFLLLKKLHGKEKSKNSILTFQKQILRVRKKVRTRFLLFKKTNKQTKNHAVRKKVRTRFLLFEEKNHRISKS